MPHSQCDKVEAAIFSQPWAILQADLEGIIAIAERQISDVNLAAAIREKRNSGGRGEASGPVAVIPVFGPIVPRGGLFANVSGAVSVDGLTDCFNAALADDGVESIVFNFSSPGGQIAGIHEFARHIWKARGTKPITAYVSDMAASAAYWLACACDRIVADRTAKVGSIGTIAVWTDDSAAKKKAGIKEKIFFSSRSPNKYLDPNSPAGQRELQQQLDDLAEIFMGEVAAFRGVAVERVENDFGKGSALLAEPALIAGMIDAVDCMESVLAGAHGAQAGMVLEGVTMKNVLMSAAGNAGKGTNGKTGKAATRAEQDEDDDKPGDEAEEQEPKKDEDKDASAETTEPEEDDEEREKEEARKAKAANAGVYEIAFAAGIRAERNRLREIRELGIAGHRQLVEDAMFKTFLSAAETAIAYTKAEGRVRKVSGQMRREESAGINVPIAPEASGMTSDQEAVAAMLRGARDYSSKDRRA